MKLILSPLMECIALLRFLLVPRQQAVVPVRPLPRRCPPARRNVPGLALVVATLWLTATAPLAAQQPDTTMESRLSAAVEYLASEELEGRGIGTQGLDKAADYLAEEFSRLGLKTELFEQSAYQTFAVLTEAELGPPEENSLVLLGPPEKEGSPPRRIELQLGRDFNPLAIGGSGQVEAPLVFVGYGITAPQQEYDDYEGIDVEGKVVVILRKEPQQDNPHGIFNGNQNSEHAYFRRKVSNAYEHGAAAVILVNDQFGLEQKALAERRVWEEALDRLVEVRQTYRQQPAEELSPQQVAEHQEEIRKLVERIHTLGNKLQGDLDEVLEFQGAGQQSSRRSMPVFFCRRAVIDEALQAAAGVDLKTLEQEIERGPQPKSQPLEGWSVACQASVLQREAEIKNVIAVLEGEGPLADETIVVGAHYDHLGDGGANSLAPWTRTTHYGADDNASGTAALLEVARRLANREQKLPRRIVFIAFTGEERGLLGSAHYVREPLFPLEKTVAMLNMDMVGRLRDDKLIVYGTGTAAEFEGWIEQLNEKHGFQLTKHPGGFGPSDHASFYAKQIPVLHFFTGTHSDYHRPSDTVDKINVPGLRRVTEMVTEAVVVVAEAEKRPQYQETQRPQVARRGGSRPYFGSIPDFSQEVEGYALMGVTKDSPADRAGLKAGDLMVKFGDSKVGGLEDFDSALRKYKAGDRVPVVVRREGQEVTVEVTLDPPR